MSWLFGTLRFFAGCLVGVFLLGVGVAGLIGVGYLVELRPVEQVDLDGRWASSRKGTSVTIKQSHALIEQTCIGVCDDLRLGGDVVSVRVSDPQGRCVACRSYIPWMPWPRLRPPLKAVRGRNG